MLVVFFIFIPNLGTPPDGWEESETPDSDILYINASRQLSRWQKPEVLPVGWEEHRTSDGSIYYVDRIRNMSQFMSFNRLKNLGTCKIVIELSVMLIIKMTCMIYT